MAQEQAGCGQGQGLACGIVGNDAPAVQRRLHAPGQHAVGGDQRHRLGAPDRLADNQGNRLGLLRGLLGLNQAQVAGGGDQRTQGRAFGDPLVGHRGRAQGQGYQLVACGVRRRPLDPSPGRAEFRDEGGVARLRMILGPRVQTVPDCGGHVGIEARQHHGAHRQPRHRAHEIARRPVRAGRARDDHRPLRQHLAPRPCLGKLFGSRALAAFAILRRVRQIVAGGDLQKGQRAAPVLGVVAGVDAVQRLGIQTFQLHLGHQPGQRGGQFRHRLPLRQIGLGAQRGVDQPPQLQPAGQGRRGPATAQIRDQPQLRQHDRPAPDQRLAQRHQRLARVRIYRDPRHVLQRAGAHPGNQPIGKGAGKIRAAGQGVKPVFPLSHAAALRPAGCTRAGRRRTMRRCGSAHRPAPRRSACPRAGSAKTPYREFPPAGRDG